MTMKNNIGDFRIDNDKLWGMYRGVVEDRFDPEQLGRCRVRVLGVHDELIEKDDINGVPTIELPWAEPCTGLMEGGISGNGVWNVPLQGTYVWVFFENGNWMQTRFFASAPGAPEVPPIAGIGFNDPALEWPRADWCDCESDLHRLMRGDKLGETTLLMSKVPARDVAVTIAIGGEWEEYWPMYQAVYPFNTVTYTHSDVYTEIDNTLGNRRWHVYHPSNSYIEIGEIGQMTIRNAESRYDIVDLNRFDHTKMTHHRCVDEHRTSYVAQSEWEQIDGSHYRAILMIDLKTVDMSRFTTIGIDDTCLVNANRNITVGINNTVYTAVDDAHYTGATRTEYCAAERLKFTGAAETEVITAVKTKHVIADEIMLVDGERHSYVAAIDKIESGDTVHIKAATMIILEAPTVEIRAELFNDFAAETFIAGILSWSGIALGVATYSTTAGLAVVGKPVPLVVAIPAVAPAAPAPPGAPSVPAPPKPPAPPAIPTPPPPPVPPPLEYIDVPPVPDVCK